MKRMLFLIIILGASAFAKENVYNISMDLNLNHKAISMQLVVAENQKGKIINTIGDKKTFVIVEATEDVDSEGAGIAMKFVIGFIDRGQEVIKFRPRVITLENERAEVTTSSDNGQDAMTLGVTANRI
jgi:hypothetical protein